MSDTEYSPSSVKLPNDTSENINNGTLDNKTVIYFSDGCLEEGGCDQTDNASNADTSPASGDDTIASRVLSWIDWIGGKLAWGLGISSPKYYYIIEQSKYRRRTSSESGISVDMDNPNAVLLTSTEST